MSDTKDIIDVTVQCHGELQSLCGGVDQPVQLGSGAATVADAIDALAARYPQAEAALQRCACAIGDSLVASDRALQSGDVVALIPPVSGG